MKRKDICAEYETLIFWAVTGQSARCLALRGMLKLAI